MLGGESWASSKPTPDLTIGVIPDRSRAGIVRRWRHVRPSLTFDPPRSKARIGLAAAAGLIALAGILGFVGLWEFSGFKTIPGEPALGLLVLAAAVLSLFTAGMSIAWALTRRRFVETKAFGAGLAAIGVVLAIWLTTAN